MDFNCVKCGGSFSTQEALQQHTSAKHYEAAKDNVLAAFKKPLLYLVVLLIIVGLAWAIYAWVGSTPRIGPVGSTHIHQDFKVYLDRRQVDFSQSKYQVRVPYVHVEGNDGDVIHVHATDVTIGMFFDSLGMKFDSTCFKMDEGKLYCDDGDNVLKFYVNGVPNREFDTYMLKDLDKILISYGNSENQAQLQTQLASITDKAKDALNEPVQNPLASHNA